MTEDQTKHQIAQAFAWLKQMMPDGKLTQSQVIAGDAIIATSGLPTFATLIGYDLNALKPDRDISSVGYNMIKKWEGLKLTAYQDVAGIWTIGIGTIKYPNGVRVRKGDTCTESQALAYLANDCLWVDRCLDNSIKVPVTQNQFDALASLTYNIGETAFKNSTLLTKLNNKEYSAAADEFLRWINAGGKRSQGLVNRREDERKLFLTK